MSAIATERQYLITESSSWRVIAMTGGFIDKVAQAAQGGTANTGVLAGGTSARG